MNKLLDMFKDKEKMKHYVLYIIFGVLTTLVDFGVYSLLINCLPSLNENFANMIGIFASIVFAYFTNRKYVFKTKEKISFKEGINFYLSRVSTLLLDMLMMYIFVSVLKFDDKVIKLIVQVIVIVLNYVLSKFIVFKKK